MSRKSLMSMVLLIGVIFSSGLMGQVFITTEKLMPIYHDGWIDHNKNDKMDPYENPGLDIESRINDLLGRMTLEEKTCQMATLYGFCRVAKDELPTKQWLNEIWKDGIANIDEHLNGLDRKPCRTPYSFPYSMHTRALNEVQRFFIEKTRLGIPVDFTNEGIRGLCHEKATSFPAQIGVASSWDKELVNLIGHITGKEARALGYTNIYSPILDLARDPRWGRTVETYGENPYLASQLGKIQVAALQSEGVVSTPKHFAVYSIPKGGRDGAARTDPKAPWRDVETIYLAPFRAAIQDANALGVMSSYNDYNGIPITGSKFFLTQILRQRWGFKGYIVSDSDAVLYLFSKHHVAETYKEAVRQAVEAGLNVRTTFTPPDVFINPLRELVREGKISLKTIDSRVRNVLRVKFWLGLFDKPYLEDPKKTDEIVHCAEHVKVSLRAARESIVLLKNEKNLLPLSKNLKKILVVGPNAKATDELMSRYGPAKAKVISVFDGIKDKLGKKCELKYAQGCALIDKDWPESEILPTELNEEEKAKIASAAQLAAECDIAIVVLGETRLIVGESRSRTSLNLPGRQFDLVKAIHATGTPTVVVLLNGRPLTINWIDKNIPAIVEAWFPGEMTGKAVADVLFGDYNPGGKLPITFPRTIGQIPLNFPFKPGSQAGVKDGHKTSRVTGVLYPFGHGLSYTQFEYSNLKIEPQKQRPAGEIRVCLEIKNAGEREGTEVVQLYIRDEVSSVTTFVKALRGFERIHLQPGKKKKVEFVLKPEDLQLLDRDYKWVVEPGTFRVMIGASSEDIRLSGEFEIVSE
ncbi:MAG: beta-glucosidase [Calditrichaeota bacterium]|nr:beta-glucosidase [Calditrichota bacterium]